MRQWVLLRVQRIPVLRVLAETAEHLFAPSQPVGVLGVIFNADGHVLVAEHAARLADPWGLPGGWLNRREIPEHGILREIDEELDMTVALDGYVGTHVHEYGRHQPRGLTLVFRLRSALSDRDTVASRTWEVVRTRWVSVDEACALAPRTAELIRRAAAGQLGTVVAQR